VVTYCAGCSHILGRYVTTHHLVDLLFSPDAALAGKAKVTRSPFTYLNRLRLKRYFRKTLPVAVSRERTFMDKTEAGGTKKFITFLALILGVGLAVHFTGAARYLEPERLRSFIEAHGSLAPLIYVVIYSIAPALFLPGLPLTIAGGLLFGPFWGVVYAITGATLGACIAFLISRYLARECVEQKLHDQRWRKLDQQVELHGWKVVAFTRLIPLFPFNLLNYAFGLTKVRFSHYAIATFFCMLPACIAFIVFSSSVPDLLKGKISFTFLLGLVLVGLVSIAPFLYKRYRRDR